MTVKIPLCNRKCPRCQELMFSCSYCEKYICVCEFLNCDCLEKDLSLDEERFNNFFDYSTMDELDELDDICDFCHSIILICENCNLCICDCEIHYCDCPDFDYWQNYHELNGSKYTHENGMN